MDPRRAPQEKQTKYTYKLPLKYVRYTDDSPLTDYIYWK